MYADAAQYDQPPRYPVTVICGGIDGVSSGSDIISKISAGVTAFRGNSSCRVNGLVIQTEIDTGWKWQVIAVPHLMILWIFFLYKTLSYQ